METLKQWKHLIEDEGVEGEVSPENEVAASILRAYSPEVFEKLPLSLRVHLTLWFLRDLTTLAMFSDAFIVSGASNAGRLG